MYLNQIKRSMVGRKLAYFSLVGILSVVALNIYAQKDESANQTEPIVMAGRVAAMVDSLISGTGVGPKYQQFLLEAEENDEKDVRREVARIVFEYYSASDRLDIKFFEYTTRYRMKVMRKPSCDDNLEGFAFEQFGFERLSILRIMDGVKPDSIDKNSVLSCYVLRPGGYEVID